MQEAATGTTNVSMGHVASGSGMGRAGGIAALLYALWLIYLLALLTVVIPSPQHVHSESPTRLSYRAQRGICLSLTPPPTLSSTPRTYP